MHLPREFKLYSLFFATGLAMTFFQHGITTHWDSLASVEQFFEYWLIYLIALGVLLIIVGAAILATSEFFLGYRERLGDRVPELAFHILTTICVGTILAFGFAQVVPPNFLD
jgi:hypothetical protein